MQASLPFVGAPFALAVARLLSIIPQRRELDRYFLGRVLPALQFCRRSIDNHFTLIKAETNANGKTTYWYDVNCEEPLGLYKFEVQGWGIYAVWVYPPYMLDLEKNWGE